MRKDQCVRACVLAHVCARMCSNATRNMPSQLIGHQVIGSDGRVVGHNPLLGSASILKELICKISQNSKQVSKSLS